MKSPLRILHLEDSLEDSELVSRLLKEGGISCTLTRVESRSEIFDALEKSEFDLILADFKLPGFSGLRALEIAHALKPDIPFVFVSGTMGEETAIESLRNGATDYVLKDRPARLVPAVRRALIEAEERTLCRQLQQRLREVGRLEAISTLSNGIAHDFNNILTIILGHAFLLTLENRDPARVQQISGTISEAARRGAEIVQQLLAFARKSEGHVAAADLNRYLAAHLPALRERLGPNTRLHWEPCEHLPNVLVDTLQLDRILTNLIANSTDAMEEGGDISLATRLVSATEVPDLLPELASENYVCLSVKDTGQGMDAATREHVFEPFFTTKDRGRGTGLGLPVVYGLMQAHHGYLDVKSEPGRGTEVALYFPVPDKPREIVPRSAADDPALKGHELILVVEDEVDVCFFLETVLQNCGYRVVTAGDGDEALAAFAKHGKDIRLVFSDVGLPRVDGITVGERLRASDPDLPIVLASGYPTKEFRERINRLGTQGFLAKPYTMADILRTVRLALDGAPVLQL